MAGAPSGSAAKAGQPPSIPSFVDLTEKEKHLIQAIWPKVYENAEENGRLVFVRLLNDFPESKQYFKTIPTEGNLIMDPKVGFHGRRIMVTLDQVIQCLGEQAKVCKLVDHLVESHKNNHNVPVEMFQFFFQTMLRVLQELLKDEFKEPVWKSFGGFLQQEIKAAYARKTNP